jgi:hypothetical protein
VGRILGVVERPVQDGMHVAPADDADTGTVQGLALALDQPALADGVVVRANGSQRHLQQFDGAVRERLGPPPDEALSDRAAVAGERRPPEGRILLLDLRQPLVAQAGDRRSSLGCRVASLPSLSSAPALANLVSLIVW